MGRGRPKKVLTKKVKRHRRTKAEMQMAKSRVESIVVSTPAQEISTPASVEMAELPGGVKIPKAYLQAIIMVESNMLSHYNTLVDKHNALAIEVDKKLKLVNEGLEKLLSFPDGSILTPSNTLSTNGKKQEILESADPLDII